VQPAFGQVTPEPVGSTGPRDGSLRRVAQIIQPPRAGLRIQSTIVATVRIRATATTEGHEVVSLSSCGDG